ncbi:MAG: hypothetical protein DHS20C11_28780 [Lysobacteraceae bacterium]|nr:MAG: hypothetical protein DHS20C11_28780 [Xanthomonadaceae bacterium]
MQILGAILIVSGGHGLIIGEIPWSFELGPGKSGVDIDLTPDALKFRRQGTFTGTWVRPVCGAAMAIGLLLVFIFTGDTVVISL